MLNVFSKHIFSGLQVLQVMVLKDHFLEVVSCLKRINSFFPLAGSEDK